MRNDQMLPWISNTGFHIDQSSVSQQVTQDNEDCYTGSVVMIMHKHNRQTTLLLSELPAHRHDRGLQCESARIQPCYVYGVYWGFHFVSNKLQTCRGLRYLKPFGAIRTQTFFVDKASL